jgi:hypothetical protein
LDVLNDIFFKRVKSQCEVLYILQACKSISAKFYDMSFGQWAAAAGARRTATLEFHVCLSPCAEQASPPQCAQPGGASLARSSGTEAAFAGGAAFFTRVFRPESGEVDFALSPSFDSVIDASWFTGGGAYSASSILMPPT